MGTLKTYINVKHIIEDQRWSPPLVECVPSVKPHAMAQKDMIGKYCLILNKNEQDSGCKKRQETHKTQDFFGVEDNKTLNSFLWGRSCKDLRPDG